MSAGQTADRFAWLEVDDEAVRVWEAEQDTRAAQFVRGLPMWPALRDAIDRGAVAGAKQAPQVRGSWYTGPPEDSALPAVVLSNVVGERREIPLEPPSGARLHRMWPSTSGTMFAVGWLRAGGSEEGELTVIDVSGAQVASGLSYSTLTEVAWMPTDDRFMFNGPDPDRTRVAIWSYEVKKGELVLERVPTEGLYNVPQVSADGRWAAVIVGSVERRPHWIRDLRPDNSWTPFLRDAEGHWLGDFVDDSYVAVTTDGAARGRVVAIPLPLDPSRPHKELAGEGSHVVRAVQRVGQHALALSEYRQGACHVRFVDIAGGHICDLPTPDPGSLARDTALAPILGEPMVNSSVASNMVTFVHSSYLRSTGVYAFHLESRTSTVLAEPIVVNDHLRVTITTAAADDGTTLPIHIVSAADDMDRPAPTIVHAYGGFNVATLPRYLSWIAPFVELGGKVAVPIIRGGGEYGQQWWEAALTTRKQRTFDDLYSAVEHLQDQSISTPGLAFYGSSHGGLVGAVALTQRPDLFRAVAPVAGLYDLLNFAKDQIPAAICIGEYGDPADPDQRACLEAYSPVHHPPDRSPAVFVATPANDIRCPPWHSRKLVASLQAADPDQQILLRVWGGMGHAGGNSATTPAERNAEWLSFVAHHLELGEL